MPSGTWPMGQRLILLQDNSPKNTSKLCQSYIKSKEERHIFQLMFWAVQSADKSHWTWVRWSWPKSQSLTTLNCGLLLATLAGKPGQNYLRSTASLLWKECREFVKQWQWPKGSILMIQKFKKFFFLFNFFLMWLRKTYQVFKKKLLWWLTCFSKITLLGWEIKNFELTNYFWLVVYTYINENKQCIMKMFDTSKSARMLASSAVWKFDNPKIHESSTE